MNVLLVANPGSGSNDEGSVAAAAGILGRWGRVETLQPRSETTFTEEVGDASEGVDVVAVLGGDGTMNLVVCALREAERDAAIALLPAGTGNDLARSLGLELDPVGAAEQIAGGREREIDVWRAVSASGVERFFVNASIGGFPVRVDEELDPETKRRLGPAAFLVGGAKAARDITRVRVEVNGDAHDDCVAVGVGNGRTVGGGIEMWPDARLDDGQLDVCVLRAENLPAALGVGLRVKAGRHIGTEGVVWGRATEFEISADPSLELNVDGELVGITTPVRFEPAGRVSVRVGD